MGVYAVNGAKLDCTYTNDKAHSSGGLRFLMWNPTSTRLVTGDAGGMVRVWKVKRNQCRGARALSSGRPRGVAACRGAAGGHPGGRGEGKGFVRGESG